MSMPSHPEFWKTIRMALLVVGVIALGLLAIAIAERFAKGTSGQLDRSLDKVLAALTSSNTHIVEGRAEITGKRDIQELALVELRMSATRSFENESYVLKYLPAGTKRLIVRGDYRITAGYRLEPGVSLRIENGVPVAVFPEADVLGVELIDFEILSEDDGWANKITPADRATLLRELRQQMRMEARESGILDLADATLNTRLKDLLGADAVKIERNTSSTDD